MRTMGYRSKGILLFQKIDGLDICLFSMYVQEYDKDACEPNRRRVYIAYLDSVEYFRPRTARTKVYHEILASYLLWSQLRGFRAAHIWACPPQRGNNFIFWCHPQHQKTPSKDRLLEWYRAMLERARELGAVHRATNLHEEYFKDIAVALAAQPAPPPLPPTSSLARSVSESTFQRLRSPPLFEGDFWVEETLRLHFILRRRASMEAQLSSGTGTQTPGHLCHTMLRTLMQHPSAFPFNVAVDPVQHKAPRYFEIIKRPMDLGTALRKLRSAEYNTLLEVKEDVELVFENAMTYNPPLHMVHRMAVELRAVFYKEFGRVVAKCLGQPVDGGGPAPAPSTAAGLGPATTATVGSATSAAAAGKPPALGLRQAQAQPEVKAEPAPTATAAAAAAGGAAPRTETAGGSTATPAPPPPGGLVQHPGTSSSSNGLVVAGGGGGAGVMDGLAQQLEHPTWDNSLLSRISVTESVALIAATFSSGKEQQLLAEGKEAKGAGGASGSTAGGPVGLGLQLPSLLPHLPPPAGPLEHEVSTASLSNLSCCTSVSGRGAFIPPRQIVTELIRSVDKMKDDLLVLHLQPPGDSDQDGEHHGQDHQQQPPPSDSLRFARSLMAAARARIPFGDTTDPVSSRSLGRASAADQQRL